MALLNQEQSSILENITCREDFSEINIHVNLDATDLLRQVTLELKYIFIQS